MLPALRYASRSCLNVSATPGSTRNPNAVVSGEAAGAGSSRDDPIIIEDILPSEPPPSDGAEPTAATHIAEVTPNNQPSGDRDAELGQRIMDLPPELRGMIFHWIARSPMPDRPSEGFLPATPCAVGFAPHMHYGTETLLRILEHHLENDAEAKRAADDAPLKLRWNLKRWAEERPRSCFHPLVRYSRRRVYCFGQSSSCGCRVCDGHDPRVICDMKSRLGLALAVPYDRKDFAELTYSTLTSIQHGRMDADVRHHARSPYRTSLTHELLDYTRDSQKAVNSRNTGKRIIQVHITLPSLRPRCRSCPVTSILLTHDRHVMTDVMHDLRYFVDNCESYIELRCDSLPEDATRWEKWLRENCGEVSTVLNGTSIEPTPAGADQ